MKNSYSFLLNSIAGILSGISMFFVFSYSVFHIELQSPDNHLAVYNFLGIFYRDLFLCTVLASMIAFTVTGMLCFISGKLNKYMLAKYFLKSFLAVIALGWIVSYVGSGILSYYRGALLLVVILFAGVIAISFLVLLGKNIKIGYNNHSTKVEV